MDVIDAIFDGANVFQAFALRHLRVRDGFTEAVVPGVMARPWRGIVWKKAFCVGVCKAGKVMYNSNWFGLRCDSHDYFTVLGR